MIEDLGYVNPMFTVPIVYYPIENWSENKKKMLDALPPEDDFNWNQMVLDCILISLSMERFKDA